MPIINYKQAYRIFWECHKTYFEDSNPDVRTLPWPENYNIDGRRMYKDLTPAVKARYSQGVNSDNFSYEPPTAANLWQGRDRAGVIAERAAADAAAALPPTATPAVPVAPPEPPEVSPEATPQEEAAGSSGKKQDAEIVDEDHDEEAEVEAQGARRDKGKEPAGAAPAPGEPSTVPQGQKRRHEDGNDESRPSRRHIEPDTTSDFPGDPGENANLVQIPDIKVRPPPKSVHYDLYLEDDRDQYKEYIGSRMIDSVKDTEANSIWKRGEVLGKGSFGTAARWTLFDADNNVLETIVAKDLSLIEEWSKIATWSSHSRATPREVAVHRMLNPQPNEKGELGKNESQYFIKYRGYRLNKPLKCARIGMQEARARDLEKLVLAFNILETDDFRQRDLKINDFADARYQHLPAEFVWELAGALISGLQHMHKQGIVHRDFKPTNIFLDVIETDDVHLKGWGLRPLIADYGTCMPIEPARYENPEDFDTDCTEGFNAPEQWDGYPPVVTRNDDSGRPYPVNEKADVLALGMTLFQVAMVSSYPLDTAKAKKNAAREKRGEEKIADEKFLYPHDKSHRRPEDPVQYVQDYLDHWTGEEMGWQAVYNRWNKGYPDFMDMIKKTLLWNPESRPTLEEMAATVQAHLSTGAYTEYEGLERADVFTYLKPLPPKPEGHKEPEEALGRGMRRRAPARKAADTLS